MLDQSLFAFCVTQVAITKAGNASIDEALHAYNDALQKLLLDIEDDSAGESDEILAAISVLSTCEVCLSFQSCFVYELIRISSSFTLRIMAGALMLKEYRRFCEFEVAKTVPRQSGTASVHAFELSLYVYHFLPMYLLTKSVAIRISLKASC